MADNARLISVPQAAERLGVSASKGWELAQRGDLPVVRIDRSVRVPVDALDAWIEEHTQPAKPTIART